jgi:RNA polymerase sigma factor (sigma-70 family)
MNPTAKAFCWYARGAPAAFLDRWARHAFEGYFLWGYPRLLAFVSRLLGRKDGPKAEDEDVVQEAFTSLLSKYRNRPPEDWPKLARACVRNALITQLRRRRPLELPEEHAFPGNESALGLGPLDSLSDDEERAALLTALWHLEPAEQQILRLKDFAELSLERIGSLLGITENAAQLRHKRARTALRRQLQQGRTEESQ